MEEDFEIDIVLEPSNYIKQRNNMLQSLKVPTLAEATLSLGRFANFVYAECDEGLKILIGKHRIAPYSDWWVSPSCLLREEIIRTIPPSKRHMYALTHEGVAESGWRIEQMFMRELNRERQEALDIQKRELNEAFEQSIIDQIIDAEEREKAACREEIKRLTQEFEKTMIDQLNAMQKKLGKEFAEIAESHELKIKNVWEAKIKAAVKTTTNNITFRFLEDLSRQEDVLAVHFKGELTKREITRKFETDKAEADYKKNIQKIKHHLECQHISNMMYILCMERIKCKEEANRIENYYKKMLRELNKKFREQKQRIEDLKQDIEKQMNEIHIRSFCIQEILKQYQKFVRFALQSVPRHANFLLSIEKLLLFELTDTLSKVVPGKVDQISQIWTEHKKQEDEKWERLRLERLKLRQPKHKEEPFFRFSRKSYLREEFIDLIKLGIELNPEQDIWSEDVQELLIALKDSVSQADITDSNLKKISSSIFGKEKRIMPHRSSFLQVRLSQESSPCKDLVKVVKLDEPHPLVKRPGINFTTLKYNVAGANILSPIDYTKLGISEENPCLLSVRSSRELLKMKANQTKSGDTITIDQITDNIVAEFDKQPSLGQPEIPSEELKTAKVVSGSLKSAIPRDSVILRKTSIVKQQKASFSISPKDSIEVKKDSTISGLLSKKSSKLVAAIDSLEYIRQSLLSIRDTAVCSVCHKRESLKEGQYQIKDFCCEKCLKMSKDMVDRKLNVEEDPKQIKVANVEVIEIPVELDTAPRVVIQPEPKVIKTKEEFFPETLAKMYKPSKKVTERRRRIYKDPCLTDFKPLLRIDGDGRGQEHLEQHDVFTKHRVRSFINLMSDHPDLIRLFTACQR